MEAKRTIKTDMKFKDIVIKGQQVVDFETGEEINLIGALKEVYGEDPFSLACTTKSEEILELEGSGIE